MTTTHTHSPDDTELTEIIVLPDDIDYTDEAPADDMPTATYRAPLDDLFAGDGGWPDAEPYTDDTEEPTARRPWWRRKAAADDTTTAPSPGPTGPSTALIRAEAAHTAKAAGKGLLRSIAQIPFGAYRVTKRAAAWVLVLDDQQLNAAIALASGVHGPEGANAQLYLDLVKHRGLRQRRRFLAALAGSAPLALAATQADALATPEATIAITAGALVGLSRAGRNPDQPKALRRARKALDKPTSDMLEAAFTSLGIKGLAPGCDLRWIQPPARDPRGWSAVLAMPRGITAKAVIAKAETFASAVGRRADCVYLEQHDAHAGAVSVYISDQRPGEIVADPWSCKMRPTSSVFDPYEIGITPRGNAVTLRNIDTSYVIGGIARTGKTGLLKEMVAAHLLDPRARVVIGDLKGGSDFVAFEEFAELHADVESLGVALQEIQDEMKRRYAEFGRLSREGKTELCPEGKLTEALAETMPPILVVIDEARILFDGMPAQGIMMDLMGRGPAAGICVALATQRPDSTSLPPAVTALAGGRICFAVADWRTSELVLSDSTLRASDLSPEEPGVAVVRTGNTSVYARLSYLSGDALEATRTRIRDVRRQWATDHSPTIVDAEVIDDTTPAPDTPPACNVDAPLPRHEGIRGHLVEVWPAGEERAWTSDLLLLLQQAYPGVYDTWTVQRMGKAITWTESIQIKAHGKNRRGLTWDQII